MAMLVLTRLAQETIMIGDDIEVKVVETRPGRVRLGFTVPPHIPVHRREVWDKIQAEKQRADTQTTDGQDPVACGPRPGA